MKTLKKFVPKPDAATTAVAVTALLAGIALGVTAHARRKELGKATLAATEKVGDTASKTGAKLIDLIDSAKTRLGDAVINFADGLANDRTSKVQALRNPEMLHAQHPADSQRAA